MSKQIDKSAARKPRLSPRQLAANRDNARRSTGPSSPEGKTRSALNALKHGILATREVTAGLCGKEQAERFMAHRDSYFDALAPADQVQADLGEQIVSNRWRMAKLLEFEHVETWRLWNRTQGQFDKKRKAGYEDQASLEDDILLERDLSGPMLPPERHTALIMRYRGSLNSEYFRAMAELRRLKKDRACNEGIYSLEAEDDSGDDGINSVLTEEEEIGSEEDNYQTNPNAEYGTILKDVFVRTGFLR
jgi:hypothetical protein